MINLSFNITNPFSDRWADLGSWSGSTPMPNKYWEAQIMKTSTVVGFGFNFTACTDHAGIGLELALLGFELNLRVYDSRHWDHENRCWKNYERRT